MDAILEWSLIIVSQAPPLTSLGPDKYYRDRGANAALTSCATVAIRFNPAIQTYYRRLIARGVHPNKAKNNCKFKIINILLSMLKTRTKFDMEKYGKSVAQWGNASA